MGESTRYDWRHSPSASHSPSSCLLSFYNLCMVKQSTVHPYIFTGFESWAAAQPSPWPLAGGVKGRGLPPSSAASPLPPSSPLRDPYTYGIVSCLLIFSRLALAGCINCPRLSRSAGCGAFGCLGRLRSRIYSFEDLIEFLFCALCKAAALLSEEEKRREGGRRRDAFSFLEPFPHIQSLASLF